MVKKAKKEPRKLYVLYDYISEPKEQIPASIRRPDDIYASLSYHEKYPLQILCTVDSGVRFTVYDDVLNTHLSPDHLSTLFNNSNIGTNSPDDVENHISMIARLNKADVVRGYAHFNAIRVLHEAKTNLECCL